MDTSNTIIQRSPDLILVTVPPPKKNYSDIYKRKPEDRNILSTYNAVCIIQT
jgi:hypothetical protein